MAFFPSLMGAFKEIFTAPFLEPRLWWLLAPVLGLWIILEIYMNEHKHEELGWNSALANAIMLFWIALAAIQPLFLRSLGEPFLRGNFVILCIILAYSVFLIIVTFRHTFDGRITYILATPTIVHYLSVFAILWGNKALALNKWILLAFFILWALLGGLWWLLFWLLPDKD